ncbi:Flavodoxin reductase (ferredoxin-NADPH reductase) family 1, Vanillate O-demethylase oxidoreductase [Pseudonocardia sp. Ae168_Ps1]|uniref:PDR/VanB family oxidoreductase n=1 Tax=unclassified Pseudonocardia TaxID=2619320 RepID=UPI00094B4E39|nr:MULTISPECIES: PDR/VanB family oxidoreductase [unclassified Pseudonocardia]OLL72054.1 Flavodoxin reductase (ferredoxin-NADPH reductase) family 1 Vanillate O-demethylase oxidoreductase [Pseudonocardia sp. Ae150A_Ps1]OLL78020.1 Flavodoxin reductase (ferredoxin-NADPH reductase) family 1, Vanillate O-demethylase oxidoreductase [Pseudonocardia sp. Ae168_Ps1]OLL87855.1 Flavodoxin reductase (ferredoxin-NADPH reductase) family 1, Vanillate O-demethylase oxidoreductase [Pseudonocardia sp. Ae263_Ps1]OL
MDLMVEDRRDEADGVVSLTLVRARGGELPPWTPGAHVDLRLADGLVRQYSLCSDPADRTRWRIGVRREPDGRGGSRHVFDKLHGGDIVDVGDPRNHFELVAAAHYVFVAGGIGITPLLPMIDRAERAGAGWSLLYGGRSRSSMAFADELARYGDRVVIAPQDEVGLPDLATPLDGAPHGTLVYACGPEALLDALAARTAAWAAGSLHVERFAPRTSAPAGRDGTFEVEFVASGVTAVVGPDRSVLDVAEEAGIRADWSCREGTCGTCEAGLLGGRAEHRDSVLDDDERAAQDCMMICVSRAEQGCPALRIDL